MAELKIPVQIDGFKCVEEMAQAVLNYTYKGKMLQEWADSISNPKTNADRIRSMTDEELAEYLYSRGNDSEYCYGICTFQDECKEWKSREFCIEHIVEWLKQEAK